MFYIVEVDNDGFKVYDSGGTLIDPAKDSSVQSVLTSVDAIKNTDGIKKITDALPAGTNEIGKVAQGTKAANSAAWPEYIVDSSGNVVGVVLDDTVYRIQADSKIAKGSSALVHLDAIDTTTGKGRLKSTLYSPEGEAVAFNSLPSNPASVNNAFVLDGTEASLLVDGSSTPVVYSYDADSTYDISIQLVMFIMTANTIVFGENKFGVITGLTNGLKVEITSNSNTGQIINMQSNECFTIFSGNNYQKITSSKDMLTAAFIVGGSFILKAGTSDKVAVTVQDDLTTAANCLKCYVMGNLLASS